MSSVNRHVRGNFINALQELMPALVIKPHQIAAAKHPARSTKKTVTKRSQSDRTQNRHINDVLSGKAG